MEQQTKQQGKASVLPWMILLGIIAYSFGVGLFGLSYSVGPNYRNVTIDTQVNITGSAPTVTNVIQANPITLVAGSTTIVTCNASVRDYNGFADISAVNATFFHVSSTYTAAANNNTHYVNASCEQVAGQASGFYANYTCQIELQYYAVNGTWNCTVVANDSINLVGNNSNLTNISALYALNLSNTLIDYGNLTQGQYSDNVSVNVSNLGNHNINVSVSGYARNPGDGYSFVCDQGNFSIGVQHYTANESANFTSKQTLATAYTRINGLTINKTTNVSESLNSTYWQMYADPAQSAFGNCTGFVIFQAEQG